MVRKKRAGRRPAGPYSDKRAVITTRITEELRKALEAARERSGQSLSQEIEIRLRNSFNLEKQAAQAFGSQENFAFARLLIEGVAACEGITQGVGPGRWYDNPFATEAAARVAAKLLLAFRPDGPAEPPAHLRWTPDVESFADSVALGILEQLINAKEAPVPETGVEYSTQIKLFPVLHQTLDNVIGRLI